MATETGQLAHDRDRPAAEANTRAARGRSEILALSCGLAAILIVGKFILLPFPVQTAGEFFRWALRLALVAAPDVCFVAGLGVVALTVNRAAASWSRVHGIMRFLGYTCFYACGVFGVASVGIYRWTMAPLSWQALEMAGGAENFSSSVTVYATWQTMLALLAAPAAAVLLPTVVKRIRRWKSPGGPAPQPVLRLRWAVGLLLVIAAYGLISRSYIHANWTDPNRWERRIAQSPHAVFLQSLLESFVLGERLPLDNEVADTSDFELRGPAVSTYAPASARPRNVVVIVLESTAAEYTSLARNAAGESPRFKQSVTPNLAAAVAAGGVVFENAYVQAPSSCKSLISLTAGIFPRTDWWLLVRDRPNFTVPTVAEVLVKQGYRTCFAHSGYWSWKNRDRYLTTRGGQTLIDADTLPAAAVNSWGISDEAMFGGVLDWIDQTPGQPFFAMAYTIETHHPYVLHGAEQDFGVADATFNRYLNSLHETDQQIGKFLAGLRSRGVLDETLVIVTADHGECFGQHNQRIHSFAIYDPAVHVPLAVIHPSLADQPARDARLAAHVDLAPTILDMLGLDIPADWQGQSLLAAEPRERNYFFCTGNEIVLGLREGSLKYHYYVESGFEELFDLSADPDEAHNLLREETESAGAAQEKSAAFRRRLAGFIRYQREFLQQHGGY